MLPARRSTATHRAHDGDTQQPSPETAPDVGQSRAGDEDIRCQAFEGRRHERKEEGIHLAAAPQIFHADTGLFDLCIKVGPARKDQHGDMEASPVQTAGQLDHLALGAAKTRSSMTKSTRIHQTWVHPHVFRANLQVRSRIALRAPWAYRLFMSNPHPHTSDSPLRVVVSLDVEEEGLFPAIMPPAVVAFPTFPSCPGSRR